MPKDKKAAAEEAAPVLVGHVRGNRRRRAARPAPAAKPPSITCTFQSQAAEPTVDGFRLNLEKGTIETLKPQEASKK